MNESHNTSPISSVNSNENEMDDEIQQRFDEDIERMKALRSEIAALGIACFDRLEESDIEEMAEMRDQILALVNHKRGLTMTLAMCEVFYGVMEQLENASIIGFIAEQDASNERT